MGADEHDGRAPRASAGDVHAGPLGSAAARLDSLGLSDRVERVAATAVLTLTGDTYQPLFPSTPTRCGVIVGGVTSMTRKLV